MANFSKIDPNIWDRVKTFSADQTFDCLVWVEKDFSFSNISNLKYHYYPFIRAFKLNSTYCDILSLSDNSYIKYISSVQKASTFLNCVCQEIDAQTLFCSNCQGKDVCVAVIDTGCSPHVDLMLGKNRIEKFVDFVNGKEKIYDDNGHGTFVCGVIAGNGLLSNKKYHGIAPKSKLVVLKALNKNGETQVFTILDAMQWIIDNKERYNIKVVCMSFGSEPLEFNDPLRIGAEVLWDEGLVVVCASGNDGASVVGVKSPAISSKVISVGACEYKDGSCRVASFSSYGEFEGVARPDIVAPGVNVVSLSANSENYVTMSGTSVSTPVVAGAVCLMLEKSPNLTPNKIKSLILNSATKLEDEKRKSGAGVVNVANVVSNL